MGVCESLNNSEINPPKSKEKIMSKKNKNNYSQKNQGRNFFNAPIQGNSFNLNPNNTNISQSQLTLGTTINEHPFQRPQIHVYNNKSSQTSYINGSTIINGNSLIKGSKSNHNSFSMSRSCGEIIIDGKINPEMKGDKDFQNYIETNNNDIDDVINDNGNGSNSNNSEGKNKKDINLYHRINKNMNSGNKNNKNKQKEILIPMDNEM